MQVDEPHAAGEAGDRIRDPFLDARLFLFPLTPKLQRLDVPLQHRAEAAGWRRRVGRFGPGPGPARTFPSERGAAIRVSPIHRGQRRVARRQRGPPAEVPRPHAPRWLAASGFDRVALLSKLKWQRFAHSSHRR